MALTRDELVARLIGAGEIEVSGEDQAETDSYFDTDQFRFHGPDGFETDYSGLTNYFKSIRAAFVDRSIPCQGGDRRNSEAAYCSTGCMSAGSTSPS